MLSFTGSLKVFVALEPVDMRKGFEDLHAAVGEKIKETAQSKTAIFRIVMQVQNAGSDKKDAASLKGHC